MGEVAESSDRIKKSNKKKGLYEGKLAVAVRDVHAPEGVKK